MAVIKKEQYVERLRSQKPLVYLEGERVSNVADHPLFQYGINSLAVTYDAAGDPSFGDLGTVWSPLVNETINRWNHIQTGPEEALAKTRLARKMGELLCSCHYRCLTTDCLNAAWATSFEIDRHCGTDYHRRVVAIVEEAQKKDLIIGGGIVDPKGDRRYRPAEQPDPDMYLRVVERREDGIVVRGAKAHSTASAYTNMLCVFPSRPLQKDEADYAVGFFTPVDAEGIVFICKRPPVPDGHREIENPLSSRFGQLECFTVFNDVFVPWERVFMCGEYEYAVHMLGIFNAFHTWHKCGCRAASMDLSIGALSLVTEYNGTSGAPHIKDYLSEMIMNTEMVYSCALAAAVEGFKHDSGVYVPKRIFGNAGKVFAARKLGEDRYFMQEAAGGLVITISSEKDYRNPETSAFLEKYLKTMPEVPTENRMRAINLIEDLTASRYAGWYHAMCISGGATPQLLKERIYYDYDRQGSKERAMKAIGLEGQLK